MLGTLGKKGSAPGERLPAIRALAEQCGVNMMTVSKAYSLLRQEGYITADRRGGTVGTVTGGKLQNVFPAVRRSLKRTALAMHFCELFQRLTPLHQPSEAKFELLVSSLTELEYGEPNPAFAAAFTLRLMTLAGFGLDHPVLKISAEFWRRMHEDKLSSLEFSTPEEMLSLAKCNSVCRRFLNQYLAYPLNTLRSFTLDEGEDTPLAVAALQEDGPATLQPASLS